MASSDEQAAARTGTLAPSDYTDLNPSWAGAAGAAIATASDLRVYAEALAEGRFLGSRVQQQRLESVKPIDPSDPASPGYGLASPPSGPCSGIPAPFPASRPSWATTRSGTSPSSC
jgi:hypothetical protein